MQVLIYQDYIHNNGVLYRALCRQLGGESVSFCDAADIIQGGCLDSRPGLFVMPGGADLYFAEKLNGAGNAALRSYVEGGGTYLGICAGAYYACAALNWAAGTEQDITGPRELAFFPGTAVGPVYDLIEDGDIKKSWQAVTELSWDDGVKKIEAPVFYEAGPLFAPEQGTTVLARYSHLPGAPAAIIECRVGQGRAILCSPHPEYTGNDLARRLYRHNNVSPEWTAAVAQALTPYETLSRKIWATLIARCRNKSS